MLASGLPAQIKNTVSPTPSVLRGQTYFSGQTHLSSVIYFRHNDMQDCVIKLGKWYRTAVAEARGRLFVFFFGGSSRKQMLCNRFLHIVHSLDISFLYLKILAMRSWPSRKYRNCMLKVHFVVGNLRKIRGSSAEGVASLSKVLATCQMWEFLEI